MIEKVKLNEVAKDLNINGKELTTLLQQRFGGEAKKPQTVLSGDELNFVMEHFTRQHAVADFGEYFKLGEKKAKPAEKPAEKPQKTDDISSVKEFVEPIAAIPSSPKNFPAIIVLITPYACESNPDSTSGIAKKINTL